MTGIMVVKYFKIQTQLNSYFSVEKIVGLNFLPLICTGPTLEHYFC